MQSVTDFPREIERLRAINADLLAALQEVRRRIHVPPTKDGEQVFQQICAAIAKATGE